MRCTEWVPFCAGGRGKDGCTSALSAVGVLRRERAPVCMGGVEGGRGGDETYHEREGAAIKCEDNIVAVDRAGTVETRAD